VKKGPTILLTAMQEELQAILDHSSRLGSESWAGWTLHHLECAGTPCVAVRSGVGKVLASMVTQHLIDRFSPARLILSGVAGALNPDYEPGDIILARDLIQHDLDASALGFLRGQIPWSEDRIFNSCPELLRLAQNISTPHRIFTGRILTGDQFFTHAQLLSHAYIRDDLAGDAIEMEGAAVAQVCSRNQIPFLVVRTISDKADGSAHLDFNRLLPEIARNSWMLVKGLLSSLPPSS
jgi:5'-methylthioadenosine/S-adenosylhomocysteine nucleosidase